MIVTTHIECMFNDILLKTGGYESTSLFKDANLKQTL